jgi:hypothetical protein
MSLKGPGVDGCVAQALNIGVAAEAAVGRPTMVAKVRTNMVATRRVRPPSVLWRACML